MGILNSLSNIGIDLFLLMSILFSRNISVLWTNSKGSWRQQEKTQQGSIPIQKIPVGWPHPYDLTNKTEQAAYLNSRELNHRPDALGDHVQIWCPLRGKNGKVGAIL